MHTRLLLAFIFFLTTYSFAQVSQVRFEIPIPNNQNEPYSTISLQNDGLLLYALLFGKEGNAIELIHLDTAIRQTWKGYIPIDRTMYIANAEVFGDKVFMLLKDRFNPLAEFKVMSIAIENGNYTARSVKTLLAFYPSHFIVTHNAALIGGYFNYRPLVLYYNFNTNQSKILPGFFNEVGNLDQIRTDDDGNIDIVVSGKGYDKRRSLWIRSYDANGDLRKTLWLTPEDDKDLIFGRTLGQPNGNQIVAGVWGRNMEYSRGIFIANINAYGEYAIKYYNYADLERFFNYMRAKREKRVKDRIERRKVRGKKTRFNYRLMVDDLLPYGDGVVMLGEAFYPHYSYPSSRTISSGTYYLTPRTSMTRGDLVFDGYQYTHAVVIGFDKEGNLKWDNSFEINDVRTFQLEQFVKIHPDPDRISLVYLFDNVIRSKVIKDSDVLEGKSYDPLRMGSEDDVVRERDTKRTALQHWYGSVFYASGIQDIRRRRDQGAHVSRRVFFVNKIAYK